MGSVADWVGVVLSGVTVVIAWKALASWKSQLAGTKRHETALEIAMAARALRYAFCEARSPLILAGEFPESFRNRRHGEKPSNSELADEHAHVYRARLSVLWPYITACVQLRPKAGAVFGDDCAVRLQDLASKAREYEFVVAEYVQQLRAGEEAVGQWTDQEEVRRVKSSIRATSRRNDPLSREFEDAMAQLMGCIQPEP